MLSAPPETANKTPDLNHLSNEVSLPKEEKNEGGKKGGNCCTYLFSRNHFSPGVRT